MTAQPFRISIPQPVLDDLRQRLAGTRWPDELDGAGWDYGTATPYLRERDGFDWRRQEARLNASSHFMADVGGQRLHFVHTKGAGLDAVPLLMLHG